MQKKKKKLKNCLWELKIIQGDKIQLNNNKKLFRVLPPPSSFEFGRRVKEIHPAPLKPDASRDR